MSPQQTAVVSLWARNLIHTAPVGLFAYAVFSVPIRDPSWQSGALVLSTAAAMTIALFRCGRVLGERTRTGALIDAASSTIRLDHCDGPAPARKRIR